jgi:hypothetical protein
MEIVNEIFVDDSLLTDEKQDFNSEPVNSTIFFDFLSQKQMILFQKYILAKVSNGKSASERISFSQKERTMISDIKRKAQSLVNRKQEILKNLEEAEGILNVFENIKKK